MADQIRTIVAGLAELDDVSGVCAAAEERVGRGDAAFAADLGIACADAYGAARHTWQYRSVFDHLLRLLATTRGSGNVAQALRMVSCPRAADRKLDRYTASLLASGHEAEDLAPAFTGRASEELRACLVHELVLRGVVVEETPGIAGWASSRHWSHHPLRQLPLTLSDMERGADLPGYGVRGRSHSMPYDSSAGRGPAVSGGARVPSVTETTTRAAAEAMGRAVANWAEDSNGRIEARVFTMAEPLEPASVPKALPTLGLDCLRGAGKKTAVSVTVRPVAEVWRVLFAAASTGGAYNSGLYGAYGRLAAWQSLAALARSPEGLTVEEVEERARGCVWYGFSAGTDWFEQVAWDIGLAALAPDRRGLAVLAATDTD
ncbi:hypothetical protein HZZ00_20385 [Streptomyces sp. NEAU-sy36]|uniref:DUF6183 family protein n=1 Tax=unclassified Streptomyces TaxID=2593676 RepID=UPI0015D58CD6|nr:MULTISPECIES: DUF6183 family protein [unclassified Streptomyces]QLJ03105.1 hypothetical protein HZZ00_20385 [Streptomyces sp. NEAU-sy36]